MTGSGRQGGGSSIGFDCSSMGCHLSPVVDCNVEDCFHCVVVILDGISCLIGKFVSTLETVCCRVVYVVVVHVIMETTKRS